MSTIRRQSIISTLLIYAGFFFGAINTYLFVQKGVFDASFTLEQYGLTRVFIVTANFLYGFASFGLAAVRAGGSLPPQTEPPRDAAPGPFSA